MSSKAALRICEQSVSGLDSTHLSIYRLLCTFSPLQARLTWHERRGWEGGWYERETGAPKPCAIFFFFYAGGGVELGGTRL